MKRQIAGAGGERCRRTHRGLREATVQWMAVNDFFWFLKIKIFLFKYFETPHVLMLPVFVGLRTGVKSS